MFYFKAPGRLMHGSLAAGWGKITRYLEVGDDQLPVRQVDVFENGGVLRYDRFHQWDDYGRLIGLRFSRKPKWAKFFPGVETPSPKTTLSWPGGRPYRLPVGRFKLPPDAAGHRKLELQWASGVPMATELSRPLIHDQAVGEGISSCLQIRNAVKSGISRWRGIEVRRLCAGFSQIECSPPSRTHLQPRRTKCWRRSRRFMGRHSEG